MFPFSGEPYPCWYNEVMARVQAGITYGKLAGFIRAGDALIITRPDRPSSGFTNTMQVAYASEFDVAPLEAY